MLLSTILTCSLLAAPQEFSIQQAAKTVDKIANFGGVELQVNQDQFETVPLGATIVIRKFPLGVDRTVDLRLERFEVFTENAQVVVGSSGKDGSITNQQIEKFCF